jgi:hypothetical protein
MSCVNSWRLHAHGPPYAPSWISTSGTWPPTCLTGCWAQRRGRGRRACRQDGPTPAPATPRPDGRTTRWAPAMRRPLPRAAGLPHAGWPACRRRRLRRHPRAPPSRRQPRTGGESSAARATRGRSGSCRRPSRPPGLATQEDNVHAGCVSAVLRARTCCWMAACSWGRAPPGHFQSLTSGMRAARQTPRTCARPQRLPTTQGVRISQLLCVASASNSSTNTAPAPLLKHLDRLRLELQHQHRPHTPTKASKSPPPTPPPTPPPHPY